MRTPEMFPSFFVVGAQKAGTTSLHNWLSQQPDVCLPKLKETNFFAYEDVHSRGIDWYLKQFPRRLPGIVVGEVCPDYMCIKQAALRIRKWIAAPKLVFIFRHPIDRAFSQYQMTMRFGYENLPFHQALLKKKERLAGADELTYALYSYMERGKYADQVNHFRQVFPESEFLYVKFDDLVDTKERGLETYRRICEHIGLCSSPLAVNRSQPANVDSEPKNEWLSHMLHKPHFLKRFIKRYCYSQLLKKIAVKLDQWNRKPISAPPSFQVPENVFQQARNEIENLQALTGLDLKDWLARTYATIKRQP